MSLAPRLRPVVEDDDDFLRRLYGTTRAEELAATGWDDAQIDSFTRMQWHAQRTDYRKRFPGSDHAVILLDEIRVGRIWVDRGPDEIRLLDIALLPEFRRRGLGTRLIRELQDEARGRGCRVGHAVVKENVEALRLYAELGFVVVPREHPTHWFMQWEAPTAD